MYTIRIISIISIISIYALGIDMPKKLSKEEAEIQNWKVGTCKNNNSKTLYKCSCEAYYYMFNYRTKSTCPKKIKFHRRTHEIKVYDN